MSDWRVHGVAHVLPVDEALLALLVEDVAFLGREAAAAVDGRLLKAAAVRVVDRVDLVLADLVESVSTDIV